MPKAFKPNECADRIRIEPATSPGEGVWMLPNVAETLEAMRAAGNGLIKAVRVQ